MSARAWAATVGVVLVVILGGWYYVATHRTMSFDDLSQRIITVGGTTVHVETVSTEISREQGLSGRDSLAPNSGMLFAFERDAQWGIWMKDMKFSIDILWISAAGTVVTVVPEAAPDSYPHVFNSTAPARYVLELPAGWAAEHGVDVGTQVVL